MTEKVEQRLRHAAVRMGGRLVLGVPLVVPGVGWPEDAWDHHADGIVVHGLEGSPCWATEFAGFGDLCRGREVTWVVGRGHADRQLLGLLLGAGDIFSRSCPDHGTLHHLAVIDEPSQEANMTWVYSHLGVGAVSVHDE
jgi:hypothetical protein